MKLYNEFLLNGKHVNTYNDDKKTKFFKAIEYLKNNNLKALIITSKYDIDGYFSSKLLIDIFNYHGVQYIKKDIYDNISIDDINGYTHTFVININFEFDEKLIKCDHSKFIVFNTKGSEYDNDFYLSFINTGVFTSCIEVLYLLADEIDNLNDDLYSKVASFISQSYKIFGMNGNLQEKYQLRKTFKDAETLDHLLCLVNNNTFISCIEQDKDLSIIDSIYYEINNDNGIDESNLIENDIVVPYNDSTLRFTLVIYLAECNRMSSITLDKYIHNNFRRTNTLACIIDLNTGRYTLKIGAELNKIINPDIMDNIKNLVGNMRSCINIELLIGKIKEYFIKVGR